MLVGRCGPELHDRLSGWLHPLAMMMIAFAALGDARTTRQGRGAAIAAAVVAVGILRIISFAASSAAVRSPSGLIGIYGAPLAVVAAALLIALQGPRVRAWGARSMQWISESVTPRLPALRRA
jgi:lipopolysaccharide export system permease protein